MLMTRVFAIALLGLLLQSPAMGQMPSDEELSLSGTCPGGSYEVVLRPRVPVGRGVPRESQKRILSLSYAGTSFEVAPDDALEEALGTKNIVSASILKCEEDGDMGVVFVIRSSPQLTGGPHPPDVLVMTLSARGVSVE